MEERLEALEKNHAVMSNKIDVMNSKIDDLQETLKKLVALTQQNTSTPITQDLATSSTAKSTNVTVHQTLVETSHNHSPCSVRQVEMPNFDGEFRIPVVAEKQQDCHLSKFQPLMMTYANHKHNDDEFSKGETVSLKQQLHINGNTFLVLRTFLDYGGMKLDPRVHIFLSFWRGVRWKMRQIELPSFLVSSSESSLEDKAVLKRSAVLRMFQQVLNLGLFIQERRTGIIKT